MFYFAARILAVACCLAVCSEAGPFSSSAEAKTYFEKRGLKSDLAHVLRGTAFIIDHETVLPDGMIKYMRPLSAEEAALTKEQIATLLRLLEDRRTYMPDFIKACVPSYEIGVTLVSRTSQNEIRFCLSCDMMSAVGDDDGIIAHIDRGHNKILDLFRAIFPKNQVLKGLAREEEKELLTPEKAIEWAEEIIPKDPLLKRVKAMRREEQTDEILETLVNKATDAMRNWKPKRTKKKQAPPPSPC